MAFTINRNNELSESKLKELRNQTSENTNAKAIYAAINWYLFRKPVIESDFKEHKEALYSTTKQYEELLSLIRQKQNIDSKINEILQAELLADL